MKHLSALFLLAGGILAAQTQAPSRAPQTSAPRKATQSPAPIKIGVVQVAQALAATNDGKKAIAAMNAEFDSRKEDLARRKSAIADLQLRLNIASNQSAAERDDLTRRIDQQTREQNRLVEDMQAQVGQEEQKIFEKLGEKLIQVVRQYAPANGFTLVVNARSPLIYFENTVDITKDVVALYDKTAPAPATKK
jgi:Skp family chaperone for outer membrane proteins